MLMVLVAFPVWPHSMCSGGLPGSLNKKTSVGTDQPGRYLKNLVSTD
jgi:hypothetical protein